MLLWQGEEVEYAVPFKEPGITYTNDLLTALSRCKLQGVPVLLPTRYGFSQFLRNGGRAYGDISSRPGLYDVFEITTPECRNALELAIYEKATEAYARLASKQLEHETGVKVHCYKTSIALAGHQSTEYSTRGAHESYLAERSRVIGKFDLLIPFLTCRQLFCGAGGYYRGKFVISPRQMFIKSIASERCFGYWPMITLLDEPWADRRYYRIHITNGEGTRSGLTTFLRHSATSYVILCLLNNKLHSVPKLRNPIDTARAISLNVEGDWKVELEDGKKMSAIDYLCSYYLHPIEKLFEEANVESHDKFALQELKFVLNKLDQGLFEDLNKSIEWAIKLSLIEKGIDLFFDSDEDLTEEQRKETANLQYTAVTDTLYDELVKDLGIREIASDESVFQAMLMPPKNSRAELRVKLTELFGDRIVNISWNSVSINGTVFYFNELDWDEAEIEKEIANLMHKEWVT